MSNSYENPLDSERLSQQVTQKINLKIRAFKRVLDLT